MTWLLFIITLTFDGPIYEYEGAYLTMDECFDAREIIVEEYGRPIINYQAVCVAKAFPDK